MEIFGLIVYNIFGDIMKEIEILVELKTPIDKAKKILSKYEFIKEYNTIDTYYYDPLRNNLKPINKQLDECLRLRKKGNNNYITYKVDHFENKKWIYSSEYETKIEDYKMTEEIFNRLGLKKLLVINNNKSIYKSDKYEIALEEVKDLGNFLEVEYCTDEDVDVKKIKHEIQSFIDELNLDVSEELNMGKPEMMIRKNNISI